MSRSPDGHWTIQCKLCGKPFRPRRETQQYCSYACSNKANPGTGGRQPAAGLGPRVCVVCGTDFQPYRATQETCGLTCYKKSPRYQEIQRRTNARPERKERKNYMRRTSPQQVERTRAYNRKMQLAKYGLTPEDYDRLLAEQGGVCALCGKPPDPNGVRAASKLHADHCHDSGRSRALLCLNCNHGLGCFGDDPALLRKAAEYIELYRAMATEG